MPCISGGCFQPALWCHPCCGLEAQGAEKQPVRLLQAGFVGLISARKNVANVIVLLNGIAGKLVKLFTFCSK